MRLSSSHAERINFYESDTLEEPGQQIRDAVYCHFYEGQALKLIRLNFTWEGLGRFKAISAEVSTRPRRISQVDSRHATTVGVRETGSRTVIKIKPPAIPSIRAWETRCSSGFPAVVSVPPAK